jgi:hypothetical protein
VENPDALVGVEEEWRHVDTGQRVLDLSVLDVDGQQTILLVVTA